MGKRRRRAQPGQLLLFTTGLPATRYTRTHQRDCITTHGTSAAPQSLATTAPELVAAQRKENDREHYRDY